MFFCLLEWYFHRITLFFSSSALFELHQSNISLSCDLYVGINVYLFYVLIICKLFYYCVFWATLSTKKINLLLSSIFIVLLSSLICRNIFGSNNIAFNILSFSFLFVIICWFDLFMDTLLFFLINNFVFVLICASIFKNLLLLLDQHWFNWLVIFLSLIVFF